MLYGKNMTVLFLTHKRKELMPNFAFYFLKGKHVFNSYTYFNDPQFMR
jgi:hypothetical protein